MKIKIKRILTGALIWALVGNASLFYNSIFQLQIRPNKQEIYKIGMSGSVLGPIALGFVFVQSGLYKTIEMTRVFNGGLNKANQQP